MNLRWKILKLTVQVFNRANWRWRRKAAIFRRNNIVSLRSPMILFYWQVQSIERLANASHVNVTFYVTKNGEIVPANQASQTFNRLNKNMLTVILKSEVSLHNLLVPVLVLNLSGTKWLWLVDLAVRIPKHGPLDFVVCFLVRFNFKRCIKHLTNLVFSVRTVNFGNLFFLFNSWPSCFALRPEIEMEKTRSLICSTAL